MEEKKTWEYYQKQLADYLEGNENPEGKKIFEAWLSNVDTDQPVSLSKDELDKATQSVLARWAIETGQRKIIPARRTFFWAKMAASIALLIGATWWLYQYQFHSEKEITQLPIVWQKVKAENRKVLKFALPDSTIVWLNAGSELTYPKNFSNSIREVTLSGEGFFDVKRDETKRFIVHTERLTTSVFGTSFLVKDFKNEQTAQVAVATGKVKVNEVANAKRKDYDLVRNEQVKYNVAAGGMKKSGIKTEKLIGWRNGKLQFDQVRLSEIALVLQRWYDVEIVFASEDIKHRRYTATFQNVKLAYLLRMLGHSAPFTFKIKNNQVILDKYK